MNRGRAERLWLVALVPLAAAGCGSSSITAISDDPTVLIYEAAFANDFFVPDTTTSVRLRYDDDSGCLVLTAGTRSWVPLWPEGTTVLAGDGDRGVDYPGFGPIYPGDRVAAAGAGWAAPIDDLVDQEELAGCSAADGAFIVTGVFRVTGDRPQGVRAPSAGPLDLQHRGTGRAHAAAR